MQAHKLTSSQAHKLTVAKTSVVVACFAASVGCSFSSLDVQPRTGEGMPSNSVQQNLDAKGHLTAIDIGVIFADEESYYCLPLTRLGLPTDVEIKSLTSSCECVEARIVYFCGSNAEVIPALRLNFFSGHASSSRKLGHSIASLAIQIQIEFVNGEQRKLKVNVIHSVLSSSPAKLGV